jgi:hypothetical protein
MKAVASARAGTPSWSTDRTPPHYCGICGSDLHAKENQVYRPGVVLGHEFAGEILQAGPEVRGWKVGQLVAVNPNGNVCHRCAACRSGRANLCTVATLERPAGVARDGGMAWARSPWSNHRRPPPDRHPPRRRPGAGSRWSGCPHAPSRSTVHRHQQGGEHPHRLHLRGGGVRSGGPAARLGRRRRRHPHHRSRSPRAVRRRLRRPGPARVDPEGAHRPEAEHGRLGGDNDGLRSPPKAARTAAPPGGRRAATARRGSGQGQPVLRGAAPCAATGPLGQAPSCPSAPQRRAYCGSHAWSPSDRRTLHGGNRHGLRLVPVDLGSVLDWLAEFEVTPA